MENGKGKGWFNRENSRVDSVRHSLAARGYKTTGEKKDWKLEKAKRLAEDDALSYAEFKKIYLDDAEKQLSQLVEVGGIELEDVDEWDGQQRLRMNQVKVDVEEDTGEEKTYVVSPESRIRFNE
jgi:hypothetical protein